MKRTSYTYSLIRYVHDLAADERLNVGLVLFSSENNYVRLLFDRSVRRLTASFRDFDANLHRQVMRDLEKSIDGLSRQLPLFPVSDSFSLLTHVWPDFALNYQFSQSKPGLAQESLDTVHEKLYKRFVADQAPTRRSLMSRSDDDIWKEFRNRVHHKGLIDSLEPDVVERGSVSFKFDHTFRNGRLHVVAPVSFDLTETDAIRDKALRWRGYGDVLKDDPDLGRFVFLVAPPRQRRLLSVYATAMKWLQDVNLNKDIFLEDRMEEFEACLDSLIGTHSELSRGQSKD